MQAISEIAERISTISVSSTMKVAADAFENEVRTSRNRIAFPDQWPIPHACGECIEFGLCLALEPDMGEELDIEAELGSIEQRPVAGNISRLLKRPDPPQAGRRRETNPGRKRDVGYPAI